MKDKHYSSSYFAEDLIYIGDTAIGIDESLDGSEDRVDGMRQAALRLIYGLVGELLNSMMTAETLLNTAIDELKKIPGSEGIVEKLRDCGDILFRTASEAEDDEEAEEEDKDA